MKSLISKVAGVVFLGALLASCDTMAAESEKAYTAAKTSQAQLSTPVMFTEDKHDINI